MARSSYIYVVLPYGDDVDPIAAFTVKRELVAWLRARSAKWPREWLSVTRIPDGRAGDAVQLDRTVLESEP